MPAHPYISMPPYTCVSRRVQKFRSDYLELRSQFERLKDQASAEVRSIYVWMRLLAGLSDICDSKWLLSARSSYMRQAMRRHHLHTRAGASKTRILPRPPRFTPAYVLTEAQKCWPSPPSEGAPPLG